MEKLCFLIRVVITLELVIICLLLYIDLIVKFFHKHGCQFSCSNDLKKSQIQQKVIEFRLKVWELLKHVQIND